MSDRITSELVEMAEDEIINFSTKSEDYEEVNMAVLEHLTSMEDNQGSYILVNTPFISLADRAKQRNINLENMFFIDCVTKSMQGTANSEQCVFLDSPGSLTELGIATHQAVTLMKKKNKFMMIDSLSSLIQHNKPEDVAKFLHYLTGKMRLWGMKGIIITLQNETDKRLSKHLQNFCDKTIKL